MKPALVIAIVAALVVSACSSDATTPPPTAASRTATTIASSTTTLPSTTTVLPVARYAGYESAVYADPAHWLCRPERTDACSQPLDSTTVAADGTTKPDPFVARPDAPIDCFYVYPTISTDPGSNSDLVPADSQEGLVAVMQAARLNSQCKVYSPVYRQATLGLLRARLSGTADAATPEQASNLAFADVLDAWKYYMAHDNHGRGVVLIGHSQGSGMLSELISAEIDPNPDVRSHLIAAYLGGTNFAVPEGKDVGGTFKHVPLCRTDSQVGCVIPWASFRATSPPPANSIFGRVSAEAGVPACVNPAALAGGSAELHSYFTTPGRAWVTPDTVTTPFVSVPGLLTGECVSKDGFSYLSITVHGDAADPRADDIDGDLTPQWGLHLMDINLVMGDIVTLVGAQSTAYLR